jgi:hypothetical protein
MPHSGQYPRPAPCHGVRLAGFRLRQASAERFWPRVAIEVDLSSSHGRDIALQLAESIGTFQRKESELRMSCQEVASHCGWILYVILLVSELAAQLLLF